MLSWAYGPELTFNSELTARPGFSSVKVYGTVNPNSGLVFFALNHASGNRRLARTVRACSLGELRG